MTAFEWVTAVAGIVTAAATSLLAWFAFWAFRASVRQLKLLSDDSARQTRPYVNIDLSPGLHGAGFWDLTIENVGRSMARDVRIDPGPLKARDVEDHISEPLAAFFARSITLPPGSRRRVMWRMEAEPDHGIAAAGANSEVAVKVTYADDEENRYTDTFDVRTEGYGPIAPAPTRGVTKSGGGWTKTEQTLLNIEQAIRALNTHVGMLRRW